MSLAFAASRLKTMSTSQSCFCLKCSLIGGLFMYKLQATCPKLHEPGEYLRTAHRRGFAEYTFPAENRLLNFIRPPTGNHKNPKNPKGCSFLAEWSKSLPPPKTHNVGLLFYRPKSSLSAQSITPPHTHRVHRLLCWHRCIFSTAKIASHL